MKNISELTSALDVKSSRRHLRLRGRSPDATAGFAQLVDSRARLARFGAPLIRPHELGLEVVLLIPAGRRRRHAGMWVSLVWIRGCVGVRFIIGEAAAARTRAGKGPQPHGAKARSSGGEAA